MEDYWSAEYKEKIVNDLNEAQAAVKALRTELEARRKLNGELQEANALLRRRNNTLAAEIEAMKRKLADAEALATAAKQMFAEAEGYGDDWSVPAFLSEEPTITTLRDALRQFRGVSE